MAAIEFSSLDELRAGVKRAKEKENVSEHLPPESSYEAIKLADLERTLVPPLDFDGLRYCKFLRQKTILAMCMQIAMTSRFLLKYPDRKFARQNPFML
ncbi:MAG: hypothetical protein ACLUFV_07825 [Acutalibacteraceae bacterium]